MKKSSLALGLSALATVAQGASEITLTRLDCGSAPQPVSVAAFSDTYAFEEFKLQLVFSCYLIRHGSDYMIWDTGYAPGKEPSAPRVSLVKQLAQLKLTPGQVKYVGISHYHDDHIGQVASFPKAHLLIGKGDWDVLKAERSPRSERFAPWISGGGQVEPLAGDKKDVFGDGTVVMLSLPGHTPGHHALLVKLEKMGNVLLSGDTTHFHENYQVNGVPTWNFNRADTLASLDRFRQIAKNLKATVIIQHDPRDIAKLPTFPVAAK